MKKYLLVTLGVVLVAGGAVLVLNKKSPEPVALQPSSPVVQPAPHVATQTQPISKQPLQETTSWQTYKNEDYGFKIDYPSEWSIDFSTLDRVYISAKSNNKHITVRVTNVDPAFIRDNDQYEDWTPFPGKDLISDYVLAGIPSRKFIIKGLSSASDMTILVFQNHGLSWIIQTPADLFDSIIDTFKLTTTSPTLRESWVLRCSPLPESIDVGSEPHDRFTKIKQFGMQFQWYENLQAKIPQNSGLYGFCLNEDLKKVAFLEVDHPGLKTGLKIGIYDITSKQIQTSIFIPAGTEGLSGGTEILYWRKSGEIVARDTVSFIDESSEKIYSYDTISGKTSLIKSCTYAEKDTCEQGLPKVVQ